MESHTALLCRVSASPVLISSELLKVFMFISSLNRVFGDMVTYPKLGEAKGSCSRKIKD